MLAWLENEIADLLAKNGALTIGPSRYYQKMSSNRCKGMVHTFFSFLWLTRWRADPACRQTRFWLPYPNSKISAQILNLSRSEAAMVIQFITGFNNLNYHSWNKKEINTQLCRLCLESSEQAIHLADECPAIQSIRLEIFGPFGPQDWKLIDMLKFIHHETIFELLSTRSTMEDEYFLP
jgi:hypothetical protein